MRRFASVFAPRREKNDSSHPQPSASSPSLPASKKNVRRVDMSNSPVASTPLSSPHFGRGSDVGQSSASSSGSASLQTPDDIPISLDHAPAKSKSWINSWLSKKPSVTKVKHAETQDSNREWLPSHPPPLLRPPPPGIRTAPPVQDSDLDTSDSDDEDDESLSAAPVYGRSIPSSAVPISRKYLSARLQNALVSRPSASPFVLSPPSRNSHNLSYPRSINRGPLSRQETLHSLMLKKHLLHRLLDPADPLSSSEQASILPFSVKTPPSLLPPFAPSIDEIALPKSAKVLDHSPGLRRWIDRPCFEHRFSVWLPADDGITRQMVTGTRFAVPDLEFSEAIEAMIDFSERPQPEALSEMLPPQAASETPATDVPLSPTSSSSHGSLSRRLSVQPTAPSPLRNEAESPKTLQMLPPSPPPSPPQTVKRGVRFAEDDKEDQIPIGYIMRVKKQREAKAKFLQQQKEQRQSAEEQTRIEKERQQREEQRLQWEKERLAREKEKRAADEERNKRLYAEEIAAARARRETQKMGSSSKAISNSSSIASLRSNANKEPQQSSKYSRVAYDPIAPPPRRQGSEAGAANSRPSSLTGHPNHPSQAGSRPSSVYSSSSDDVTKRYSAASTSNMHGRWSSSNTSLVPPPMPFLTSPPSAFDMPLLPPTAPFMLHQYPRPRSQHSSSPSQSPSHSPSRNSMNRSTDRVNRVPTIDNISNRSSSSSPHRPMGHHRRPSDDAPPVRPSPRGRASEPASASAARTQASSMSSRSSANMPRMPHSYSGPVPSRRATAIS